MRTCVQLGPDPAPTQRGGSSRGAAALYFPFRAEQVRPRGPGQGSGSSASVTLPGAKEGCRPPPQKLGGPQAIPSSQACHPGTGRHQLAS